jgi:hypothetical protein
MTTASNEWAFLRGGNAWAISPPPKEGTIKGEEAPKNGMDNTVSDLSAAQALATTVDMARSHLVHKDLAVSTMGWVPCFLGGGGNQRN